MTTTPVVALMAMCLCVTADPATSNPLATFRASVRETAAKVDVAAAIQLLHRNAEPAEIAKRYQEVLRGLYWNDKDIDLYIPIAQTGMMWCLTEADRLSRDQEELRSTLRDTAKSIAYDLGSFTWRGWQQAGIEISPEVERVGREAARIHLRLADELQRPPEKQATAWWLIGAHALAAGEFDEARKAFSKAAVLADEGNDPRQAELCRGYGVLVESLESGDHEAFRRYVEEEFKARHSDGALAYAIQLETAYRVFSAAY